LLVNIQLNTKRLKQLIPVLLLVIIAVNVDRSIKTVNQILASIV